MSARPKRHLPSLHALQVFEAVARHGSITAAAQDLHVTHGAVSRQVKALEAYFDEPLLRRSGRGIRIVKEALETGALVKPFPGMEGERLSYYAICKRANMQRPEVDVFLAWLQAEWRTDSRRCEQLLRCQSDGERQP